MCVVGQFFWSDMCRHDSIGITYAGVICRVTFIQVTFPCAVMVYIYIYIYIYDYFHTLGFSVVHVVDRTGQTYGHKWGLDIIII